MNNRVLVAGLIAGILFFFLGWLIYGMAIGATLNEHTLAGVNKPMEEFNWAFLILGNLFSGILFAYVVDKANSGSFSSGATVGAILAFLMGASINFLWYGTSNIWLSLTGVVIDLVAFTVMGAIIGGFIGWWYGRSRTVVVADTTRRV